LPLHDQPMKAHRYVKYSDGQHKSHTHTHLCVPPMKIKRALVRNHGSGLSYRNGRMVKCVVHGVSVRRFTESFRFLLNRVCEITTICKRCGLFYTRTITNPYLRELVTNAHVVCVCVKQTGMHARHTTLISFCSFCECTAASIIYSIQ
jgi:hypothetical protein